MDLAKNNYMGGAMNLYTHFRLQGFVQNVAFKISVRVRAHAFEILLLTLSLASRHECMRCQSRPASGGMVGGVRPGQGISTKVLPGDWLV